MAEEPVSILHKKWAEFSDEEREQLTIQQLHDISMLECAEIVEASIQNLVRSLRETEISVEKTLRKLRSKTESRRIEGADEGCRLLQAYYRELHEATRAIASAIGNVVG